MSLGKFVPGSRIRVPAPTSWTGSGIVAVDMFNIPGPAWDPQGLNVLVTAVRKPGRCIFSLKRKPFIIGSPGKIWIASHPFLGAVKTVRCPGFGIYSAGSQ